MDDDFRIDWDSINREREAKDEAFRKLLCEPTPTVAEVGDRVVFAGGLIGFGHNWVRLEGVVLEKGDTSYKVQFEDLGRTHIEWIHPALVTDVLKTVKGCSRIRQQPKCRRGEPPV